MYFECFELGCLLKLIFSMSSGWIRSIENWITWILLGCSDKLQNGFLIFYCDFFKHCLKMSRYLTCVVRFWRSFGILVKKNLRFQVTSVHSQTCLFENFKRGWDIPYHTSRAKVLDFFENQLYFTLCPCSFFLRKLVSLWPFCAHLKTLEIVTMWSNRRSVISNHLIETV